MRLIALLALAGSSVAFAQAPPPPAPPSTASMQPVTPPATAPPPSPETVPPPAPPAPPASLATGSRDFRLPTPSLSIAKETSSWWFEGTGSFRATADYFGSYGLTVNAAVDVMGVVLLYGGYGITNQGDNQVVVGIDAIRLGLYGIEVSAGVMFGYLDPTRVVAPVRLIIPLYASWLPFRLDRVRVRLEYDAVGGLYDGGPAAHFGGFKNFGIGVEGGIQ